jgi:hypothetical protein
MDLCWTLLRIVIHYLGRRQNVAQNYVVGIEEAKEISG